MATPLLDALNAIGSLARLWPMHEASGGTAVDASGNADGTYTNGPTLAQAALSLDDGAASVHLDGTDDYVVQSAAGQAAANLVSPITLVLLFRTAAAHPDGTLLFWGRSDANAGLYGLGIASGKLVAATKPTTTPAAVASLGDCNDGEIHLGVAVFNGSTSRKVYLDDAAAVEDTSDVGTESTSSPTTRVFGVGRSARTVGGTIFDNSAYAEVDVEFAALINGALTDEDVASLWAALQSPDPPSGANQTGGILVDVSDFEYVLVLTKRNGADQSGMLGQFS